MRFFIVDKERGAVLEEYDAADAYDATGAPEWVRAPIGALLVVLATGKTIARRRVGEAEILQTSARAA